jgi:lauroyl/myristoyl acyltransferase
MQTETSRAPRRNAWIDTLDVYHLLVIAVIEFTRWCGSPRLQRMLVRAIAGAAWRWSKKREIIDAVLERALGVERRSERDAIAREVFTHRWEEIFSYAPCAEDLTAFRSARLEGAEHLRAALAEGRGALLWTSALGRRLAARAVLHENGFSIFQVHGTHHLGEFAAPGATWVRHAATRRFLDRRLRRWVSDIAYLSESGSLDLVRHVQRLLARNTLVCITGDAPSGRRLMPIRLLGTTQLFPAGLLSLAQFCGSPILPLHCVTARDGRLRVIIDAPIHISPEADRERDHQQALQRMAQLLESYIRRYPGQYRNWHLLGGTEAPSDSHAAQPDSI